MKKTTNKSVVPVTPITSTATKAATKAVLTPVAATATAVTAQAPVIAKAPVKSAVPTPGGATATPITIEAKIDVGFGNQLFARGQGAGLSWERGVPLECVDSKTWRLTVPAKDKLQFKLLLNDAVWAQGENVVAIPGKRVEIAPAF